MKFCGGGASPKIILGQNFQISYLHSKTSTLTFRFENFEIKKKVDWDKFE